VEPVFRLEGSLWLNGGQKFVKEVGLETRLKEKGVMDGESGELAE